MLVDGRSGAGKTTLAALLQARWPGEVDVIAMDDVYPGWDGLAAASRTLEERILRPRAAGQMGEWELWDWERGVADGARRVPPGRALIVEGMGAVTRMTASFADVTVWLDGPVELRRARALGREDGASYEPHWERWAAQERAHVAAHDPRSLADLVYEADASETASTARTSPSMRYPNHS